MCVVLPSFIGDGVLNVHMHAVILCHVMIPLALVMDRAVHGHDGPMYGWVGE